MEDRAVLLLGASNLTYSESGPDDTVPGLLRGHLERRLPDGIWRCEARPLHFGRRMAEVASRHVEQISPDFVVVSLLESPFTAPVPIAALRRRWPGLYPAARRMAEELKRRAGGTQVPGPKGWQFRGPRFLLRCLAGGEPEVDFRDALDSTKEALAALARFEDTVVICGFSFFPPRGSGTAARVRQERVARFKTTVIEGCMRHHFAWYDRPAELARAGKETGFGRDRNYADLPTRDFEAVLICDRVAAARDASQVP